MEGTKIVNERIDIAFKKLLNPSFYHEIQF